MGYSLERWAFRQSTRSRSPEQLVGQADEVTPARENRPPFVGLINVDQVLEVAERHKLQQLRKNCPAVVHDPASSAGKAGDYTADRHSAI